MLREVTNWIMQNYEYLELLYVPIGYYILFRKID